MAGKSEQVDLDEECSHKDTLKSKSRVLSRNTVDMIKAQLGIASQTRQCSLMVKEQPFVAVGKARLPGLGIQRLLREIRWTAWAQPAYRCASLDAVSPDGGISDGHSDRRRQMVSLIRIDGVWMLLITGRVRSKYRTYLAL